MRLRIIKPGLLSTVQDTGRRLYLSHGVPLSGAMDTLSARLANIALGNNEDDAVIEFTYAGALFIAETSMLIAYAGGGMALVAGDTTLPANRPVYLSAGTQVQCISRPQGCRTYLAVAGGFNVPVILGSRSTCITAGFGGLQGRALQKGDVLDSGAEITFTTRSILNSLQGSTISFTGWSVAAHLLQPADTSRVRVVPAHEFNWFDSRSVIDFLTTPYTLNVSSNRMGCNFDGATIERLIPGEMLSTAVAPGTIQVTGNGRLVLLMTDCQTTGGYPRIAQVAAVDLHLCSQLNPDDSIYFKDITAREAQKLYIELEQQLYKLAVTVKSRFY
ncbi:allophanate hydrolase subunit 2 family protein [Mucilaginibacter hurinus]|uniref:Allophanate hydrolase subunit 2 family protein n=1 Tax=Mucilaginibacter hurinus TaxID=2201324 RepID=A0A367GRZ0_9SPHI|nr:biotin-dependent carboxyltransferase family protein [Mucilaginibacter hurinus]RCH56207.1 allophanate hydrolase subunit 2 family protein [Mucilaginibacter hurinus]